MQSVRAILPVALSDKQAAQRFAGSVAKKRRLAGGPPGGSGAAGADAGGAGAATELPCGARAKRPAETSGGDGA